MNESPQSGPEHVHENDPGAVDASVLVRRLGHDFNNLFSVVLGGLTLLREELPGSAWTTDTQEVYDDIVSATREAADVVAQLTAWAGRQALSPESTDLNAMARELVPLLERALPDGIEVVLDLHASPVMANVDRGRLQHAITELVANARDAMDGGGRLTITTEPEPWPTIHVADTGDGMDPLVLAQCTAPYFSTRSNGTRRGMGLSVVEGFARASDGGLLLASEPGRGTRISIRLSPPA